MSFLRVYFSLAYKRVPDRISLMKYKISNYIMNRVEHMETKIDKIDDKLDSLLKFKWQVIGGALTIQVIVAGAFQIFQVIGKFK